jgi:hypothetical protein
MGMIAFAEGRRQRTLVISVGCALLSLAASASAECGWVLWAKSYGGVKGVTIETEWTANGFVSADLCYKTRDSILKQVLR